MLDLAWTDTFAGLDLPDPTDTLAIRALPDPGAVELVFDPEDQEARSALRTVLGVGVPMVHGASAETSAIAVLWTSAEERLVLIGRDFAPSLVRRLRAGLVWRAAVSDVTGTYAALSLAGSGALPLLSRLGAIDSRRIEPGSVLPATLAGVPALLHRSFSDGARLRILLPRSYAMDVAERLVAAAR
jgi:heterotetrameric sarcosine oxidase gamma subunit